MLNAINKKLRIQSIAATASRPGNCAKYADTCLYEASKVKIVRAGLITVNPRQNSSSQPPTLLYRGSADTVVSGGAGDGLLARFNGSFIHVLSRREIRSTEGLTAVLSRASDSTSGVATVNALFAVGFCTIRKLNAHDEKIARRGYQGCVRPSRRHGNGPGRRSRNAIFSSLIVFNKLCPRP